MNKKYEDDIYEKFLEKVIIDLGLPAEVVDYYCDEFIYVYEEGAVREAYKKWKHKDYIRVYNDMIVQTKMFEDK